MFFYIRMVSIKDYRDLKIVKDTDFSKKIIVKFFFYIEKINYNYIMITLIKTSVSFQSH